jgi:hypothetical protein
MLDALKLRWRRWRESSRQRKVDRALYKAGGGALPTRQATRGTAYAPNARQAERTAESVGSDAADDAPN